MAKQGQKQRRRIDLAAAIAIHVKELLENEHSGAGLSDSLASAGLIALPPGDLLAPLTAAEREVLLHFLQLHCDKQVARALGKRPHTVRNQLASIQQKLGVRSHSELVYKVMLSYIGELLRMGKMPMESPPEIPKT
jgi:DNA-binding CsgD family transcriptional regulator